MNIIKYIAVTLLVVTHLQSTSQNNQLEEIDGDIPINPEVFNASLLSDLIFQKVNLGRLESGLGILEFDSTLHKAAFDQSMYMVETNRASLTNDEKKNKTTTGDRVFYYGGTKNAWELVKDMGVKKGRTIFTYEELAKKIVEKWFKSRSSRNLLNESKLVYMAVASGISDKGKAYVSTVFGDYTSLNPGAHLRKQLKVPFSKPTWLQFGRKLKAYDERSCMACERIKKPFEMHKGIYMKGNSVYYRSEDLKELMKLLRGSKDGLAIEIIQKAQFPCKKPNIIDYTLPNKGYITKPVYSKKLWKTNIKKAKKEFEEKEKEERKKDKSKLKESFDETKFMKDNIFDACLVKELPKFPGRYDMNLVLIANKTICKSIRRTYLEIGDVEFTLNLNFIEDTVSFKVDTPYIPVAETATLTFRVPFEKNKYEYDTTDILPLIKKLNEPDFFIDSVHIFAYSSLEGSEDINKVLQEKRALSIAEALKQGQEEARRDSINAKVITDNGWELFKNDVEGTEFDTIGKMEKEKAKAYILENGLLSKLEPVLAKHRFAEIKMNITYDIKGEKEEPYVISRFNKAVAEQKSISYILGIQNYIFDNVSKGTYSYKAVNKQFVPKKSEYAYLLMNKLMFENKFGKKAGNLDFCNETKELLKLDSANIYLQYNKLCCKVKYDPLGTPKEIINTQNQIQQLYQTKLSKADVDMLNLKLQFRIINELDTLGEDEDNTIVLTATDRIRSILKIKDTDWKGALKLANTVLKQQKDYKYAIKILEPFIYKDAVDVELLFTYISLCTFFPEKLNSDVFATAMKKASEKDPKRFCKLLDGTTQSVQILENLKVKNTFCKACQ